MRSVGIGDLCADPARSLLAQAPERLSSQPCRARRRECSERSQPPPPGAPVSPAQARASARRAGTQSPRAPCRTSTGGSPRRRPLIAASDHDSWTVCVRRDPAARSGRVRKGPPVRSASNRCPDTISMPSAPEQTVRLIPPVRPVWTNMPRRFRVAQSIANSRTCSGLMASR